MKIISTPVGHYLTVNENLAVKLTYDELIALSQSLQKILSNTLSTGQARKLAKEHGFSLPAQTLLSACERGNIPGAEKDGTRWSIPRDTFLSWLETRQ